MRKTAELSDPLGMFANEKGCDSCGLLVTDVNDKNLESSARCSGPQNVRMLASRPTERASPNCYTKNVAIEQLDEILLAQSHRVAI